MSRTPKQIKQYNNGSTFTFEFSNLENKFLLVEHVNNITAFVHDNYFLTIEEVLSIKLTDDELINFWLYLEVTLDENNQSLRTLSNLKYSYHKLTLSLNQKGLLKYDI